MIGVFGLSADEHDTGPRHPERHARLHAATLGVSDASVEVVFSDALPVPRSALELVHTPSYIDALSSFCAEGGGYLDPDTPVVAGSWDTALLSAGAGLGAVSSGFDVSFVLTRPPGHHAAFDRGRGFCLFNNIAVTAASLVNRGERVAIVDWDVHHGNGTQEIFWNNPSVLYVSTHQYPFYPGTGRVDETGGPDAPGLNVNIPLPAGATGDVVVRALSAVAAPIVDAFAPTWVLVSAGFDAHRDDPLAQLALSAGDFADLAALVRPMAPRCVLFLEGGYDLPALRLSVGATLATLGGASYRPEPATTGGPGSSHIEAALVARRT